jgi:hypothetical protein
MDETPIDETPAEEAEVQKLAGVPEGTELNVNHIIRDIEGNVVGQGHDTPSTVEVVVHDLDEDGNVIGWHKESVN